MPNDGIQREILPIPDIPPAGLTTYDARDPDTTYPPIVPLRPSAGAPNVLVVLIDDVGSGASSAFGGPCQTPNFERLAQSGLRYTRFHTTALCSPTRSALLTGRNHHSVGMGNIAELATSAPGNSSIWPNTAAPLAKMLLLNGYSTAQFGKCHEVPMWETSPMGPYRQWPSGTGDDHVAELRQELDALDVETAIVEARLNTELAADRVAFATAVQAELGAWTTYIDVMQATTATSEPYARQQREAAIRPVRERRATAMAALNIVRQLGVAAWAPTWGELRPARVTPGG